MGLSTVNDFSGALGMADGMLSRVRRYAVQLV